MNTSFSKKRHISNTNILLEQRFLVENSDRRENKILNEQAETPESFATKLAATMRGQNREAVKKSLLTQLNMYPSIQGAKGVDFLKRAFDAYARIYGESFPNTLAKFFLPNRTDSFDKTYVADTLRKNGVTIEQLPNSYKFTFPPYQEPTSTPGAATPPGKTGLPGQVNTNNPKGGNKTSNFTDCSKTGIFKLNCKDTRPKEQNEIMKIQACLGVKADGYFGKNTTAALNSKFPNLGGVVKTGDINTICQSQITPVGLSGDSDPGLEPQNQPPQNQVVVPPVSPLTNNAAPTIPTPQVNLTPQQKAELTKQYRDLGARYSEERAKLLKANPGMTEDQVKQQLSQMVTQLNNMYAKLQ